MRDVYHFSEIHSHAISLASELVRIGSPTPPGDVELAISAVRRRLDEYGLRYTIFEPEQGFQNLICSVDADASGAHGLFNAHIDTFPYGDPDRIAKAGLSPDSEWIAGPGIADMKGGVAIFVELLRWFAERRHQWKGRLTLCLVCEEESFGPRGLRALITRPEVSHPDWVLSAEPSGRGVIRYGERGLVWCEARFAGVGGHGSYSRGSNPIEQAAAFIVSLRREFDVKFASGPKMVAARHMNTDEALGGAGAAAAASLNIGTVRGGRKINMSPDSCALEIDIRIPLGMAAEEVAEWLRNLVRTQKGEAYIHVLGDANCSQPDGPLFHALAERVTQVTSSKPVYEMALGTTDARLWRRNGVAVAQYGADPLVQGSDGEAVSSAELKEMLEVHGGACMAMLDFNGGI